MGKTIAQLKGEIAVAEAAQNWRLSMELKKEWFGLIMGAADVDGISPATRQSWQDALKDRQDK